jgi:AGCS family alanine or glycine:cation symporter
MGIDAAIDAGFGRIAEIANDIVLYAPELTFAVPGGAEKTVEIPLIVIWLAFAALFFTFYLKFVNVRYFKHAFDCLTHKYDEPAAKGQISNFDSLAACLSATIGLGNIAGVAVAITVGGPGAAFWMGVMGIFGMASKFAEVTMGLKYRKFPDTDRPDEVAGGPMYYLREAFEKRGFKKIGIIMGGFFALCCIGGAIGGGNMFQANQVYQQILYATGGETSFLYERGWMFGLGFAALAGLVTLGGLKPIAAVAAKLTPMMAVLYILAGLTVIAINYEGIPAGLASIFNEAWSLEAGWGGLIGAIIVGVTRATFAHEAGLGTAAIIQASAKTDFPVRQGLVGGLGPFLDTFFVCMITALVIIISGVYDGGQGLKGIELTSRAFETVFPNFKYVLTVIVFLFAYSTIIVYSYYGEKCLGYLIGDRQSTALIFRAVFLCFIVVGSAASLSNIIDFADAMFLSMAIPNIIGLYLLAPELKWDVREYLLLMGFTKPQEKS